MLPFAKCPIRTGRKPDWNLLALPGAAELPAVRSRQENLGKLSSTQRAKLVSRLEAVLQESKKK
jgi:hypothetical protein